MFVLLNAFLALEEHFSYWPRTGGGRLRLVNAITHVLHHEFGHFVKENKRNAPQNRLIKFSA